MLFYLHVDESPGQGLLVKVPFCSRFGLFEVLSEIRGTEGPNAVLSVCFRCGGGTVVEAALDVLGYLGMVWFWFGVGIRIRLRMLET